MKKHSFLLIAVLLMHLNFYAQKKELGKVTVEELSEKSHPTDSSAVAAILFKKGEVRYEYSGEDGFTTVTKVSCKIKIYKKEGYEWANHQHRYYIGGNSKEALNYSNAATYNLVDGKVEKTKLKSNGEFDEKVNKFWGRKKITMPNVKEGSIIEFQYEITSPFINTLEEWEFQHEIPVGYSEFKTYIPEYFAYTTNQKGFVFPKTTKDSKPRTISYSYMEKNVRGSNSVMPQRVNSSMDFKEEITTYQAENLPAMKEEDFVNNIRNYTSSISHELAATRYPNQPIQTLSSDWASVTKTIYESEDFGSELNKTGYFEDDLKGLVQNLGSQDEKIAAIFNFVKSKVKWNEFYGYYCSDGVRSAYKNKSGNVAEINLMLTAMLRYAGIDANPVLISTRSNGIALFPNRSAYNYVISAVEINDGLILLDATNKNALPNILPVRDLNWFGRMIRKDGTSAEVDLMPKMVSKDIVNLMASISNDGAVEGKIREQYYDFNAFAFRSNYAEMAQESQMERLEKKHKGIEVDGYEITNKLELDKPIIENYSFKSANSTEIIGDKMYFSPMLFFAMLENPFRQEVREYPIDFSYPFQDKYSIALTIPEGYVIETLPESVSIPMSDNIGVMKFMITGKDKQIQVVVTLDINSAIIPSEYYAELKSFFAEVVKKETEKVVLKKA